MRAGLTTLASGVALALVLGLAGTASAELTHWWRFDEGSGTTAADSVGSIDGTLLNMDASSWTNDSIFDTALYFTGLVQSVDLFLDLDAEILPTSDFSVSLWAKYSSDSGYIFGCAWDSGTQVRISAGSASRTFYSVGDPLRNVGTLSDLQWHHHVLVNDTGTGMFVLYGDKVAGASAAPGSDVLTAIYHTYLGARDHGGNQPVNNFVGFIDEVGIFDHALSQTEIDDIFDNGLSLPPTAGTVIAIQ
jgi:hypothetical protein